MRGLLRFFVTSQTWIGWDQMNIVFGRLRHHINFGGKDFRCQQFSPLFLSFILNRILRKIKNAILNDFFFNFVTWIWNVGDLPLRIWLVLDKLKTDKISLVDFGNWSLVLRFMLSKRSFHFSEREMNARNSFPLTIKLREKSSCRYSRLC